MKVIDAIIQLQKFDPNADLFVDMTSDNAEMFKFGKLASIDEIDISHTGIDVQAGFVLLSSKIYDADDDFDSKQSNLSLN